MSFGSLWEGRTSSLPYREQTSHLPHHTSPQSSPGGTMLCLGPQACLMAPLVFPAQLFLQHGHVLWAGALAGNYHNDRTPTCHHSSLHGDQQTPVQHFQLQIKCKWSISGAQALWWCCREVSVPLNELQDNQLSSLNSLLSQQSTQNVPLTLSNGSLL